MQAQGKQPGHHKRPKKNQSKLWFETYLHETGHLGGEAHEPELHTGSTNPDYRVEKGGASAVCDIKEFKDSALHRGINTLQRNRKEFLTQTGHDIGPQASTIDPKRLLAPVRRQIKSGADNLRPLKDRGLPLAVVIANPNQIRVSLGISDIGFALYGDPMRAGILDDTGHIELDEAQGCNGELTNNHPFISAVIILHRRAYINDLAEEWQNQHKPLLTLDPKNALKTMHSYLQEQEQQSSAPSHYFYVEVFHTLSAMNGDAVPIPPTLFDGVKDRRYTPNPSGQYTAAPR